MLKSPSHSYEDSFSESHLKMPMTDEMIEQYIHAVFDASPKSHCATAPASEWLDVLYKYNEHDGHYMLTTVQQIAIKPYCEMNGDLEMTPEEIISLIYLIRHGHQKRDITPHASASTPIMRTASSIRAKKLLDSRPRSSKILSQRAYSYYDDDRSSINHPPTTTAISNQRNDEGGIRSEENNEYVKKLKKESSAMKSQLRHYEKRIADISKEYAERTAPLQSKIEHLQIELMQQREIIEEQKHKERDRLEKITELKTIVHDLETRNELAMKKIQKREEENEKLREDFEEAKLNLDELQGLLRVHEKEKVDLHMKVEQEKLQTNDLRQELQAQRNENTKLLELIDRQKFDLDEARSGLRYYYNSSESTPSSSLKKDIQQPRESTPEAASSLAQEQIEAQYLKKLELLKNERDQLTVQLVSIKNTQKQRIEQLSLKYDQQLHLIDTIQAEMTTTTTMNKRLIVVSIIPWSFLLFHIYLIVSRIFIPYEYPFQPFYILQYIDEWFYKYYYTS